MTAAISAYGRLGQDPRRIETRTGNAMAVASMAVDIGEGDDGPLWLGIVCFGAVAETLLGHIKGDLVSACGRLQLHTYTTRDGETRQQWQVVADAIISARTVRPGGGRKRTKRKSEQLEEFVA